MMVAHTRKGKVVKEMEKRAVTIILTKVVLMHLTTIFYKKDESGGRNRE